MPAAETHRVLVIAYYFPPLGLSGVQRSLKFVKYLPEFGWEPTVLTVESRGYFAKDESLLSEIADVPVSVVRTPSMDPLHFFRKTDVVKMPSGRMYNAASRISQSFFIPDNKIGWRRKALAAARELIRRQEHHLIFATAPPYTDLLIGARLKKEFRIPYVIDYRDAWVDNPLHFYITPLHRSLHLQLERRVLRAADGIVTINRRIKELILARYEHVAHGEIEIIPQGFDQQDFDGTPPRRPDGKFRITHSGTFYYNRSPEHFLKAVELFLRQRPEARSSVELVFLGHLTGEHRAKIEDPRFAGIVRILGYLPHAACISILRQSDVLWMTLGDDPGDDMMSTGKLFEYLGARSSILGLVPEGVAKRTIREYGAGVTVHPHDVPAIAEALTSLYDAHRQDRRREHNEEFVRQHDRRQLTGRLVKLFNSLLDIESAHRRFD